MTQNMILFQIEMIHIKTVQNILVSTKGGMKILKVL